ncbi:MAG: CopG family transcriptional regulator [Candidatus Aminicenantes bacterium]|nr:MAG: CopG family transcriptional regulator [Candidatus Aminicenantes bacterium]
MKRNLTISLSKSLLKKAKLAAVLNDKSLSELIRESLEEKIRRDTGYSKAKARQSRLLKKGLDLGTKGHITISREELHARK